MSETSSETQGTGKQTISQNFTSIGASPPFPIAAKDDQKGVAPEAILKTTSASERTWQNGAVSGLLLTTGGGSGNIVENGAGIGRERAALLSSVGGDDPHISEMGSEEREGTEPHATPLGPFSVIPEFATVPAHGECAFEVAFSPRMMGCRG